MQVSSLTWELTLGVLALFLLADVLVVARKPHTPSMRECTAYLVFYVSLAVLFGLFVWRTWGGQYAGEFYAGWLTEYSLSVDNLFVFLLIMAKFRVPERLQQSALLVGIIIAIVLRGIFIALGAAVINSYAWVFYIFGAFLIYTAVKLAREGESDDADLTRRVERGQEEDDRHEQEVDVARQVQVRVRAARPVTGRLLPNEAQRDLGRQALAGLVDGVRVGVVLLVVLESIRAHLEPRISGRRTSC